MTAPTKLVTFEVERRIPREYEAVIGFEGGVMCASGKGTEPRDVVIRRIEGEGPTSNTSESPNGSVAEEPHSAGRWCTSLRCSKCYSASTFVNSRSHWSEVMRIVAGGIDGVPSKVRDYTMFLADKIELDGDIATAERFRKLVRGEGGAIVRTAGAPPAVDPAEIQSLRARLAEVEGAARVVVNLSDTAWIAAEQGDATDLGVAVFEDFKAAIDSLGSLLSAPGGEGEANTEDCPLNCCAWAGGGPPGTYSCACMCHGEARDLRHSGEREPQTTNVDNGAVPGAQGAPDKRGPQAVTAGGSVVGTSPCICHDRCPVHPKSLGDLGWAADQSVAALVVAAEERARAAHDQTTRIHDRLLVAEARVAELEGALRGRASEAELVQVGINVGRDELARVLGEIAESPDTLGFSEWWDQQEGEAPSLDEPDKRTKWFNQRSMAFCAIKGFGAHVRPRITAPPPKEVEIARGEVVSVQADIHSGGRNRWARVVIGGGHHDYYTTADVEVGSLVSVCVAAKEPSR